MSLPAAPFQNSFAYNIYSNRYQHPEDVDWDGTAQRVAGSVMYEGLGGRMTPASLDLQTDRVYRLFKERKALPGGRYLYAAGRDFHQVNNCVLMRCDDSREGWASTSYNAEMALMTGAGIGVWYGDVRESGKPITKTGGTASGPIAKMAQVNDTGRHIMQGGNRRSAIWAGLPWSHPDVFDFITVKDWPEEIKELKRKAADRGEVFPAVMDMTNISVTLDDEFFAAYGDESHPSHAWAHNVYWTALGHMLRHGEPGFTVDVGEHSGEVLRNACTEITSADDSDVCNLGSLVLPRFSSPEEFQAAVADMTLFLTAGSEYSDVPYDKVREVRDKNRRLGLGLIGVHEFCMQNGVRYGTDAAFELLEPYMEAYASALERAHEWQHSLGLSLSKGATAIAPNGTIGIVAESTPSADPMFSRAEVRTVKVASPKGDLLEKHVVVDPVAKRLREAGVPAELIEDAYVLAEQPARRLAQQAFLQDYTDHAISSTVNLPHVVTDEAELRAVGDTLMEFLPRLRGITFYPDGARAGQPREPADLDWALSNEGVKVETDEETCVGGVCGI